MPFLGIVSEYRGRVLRVAVGHTVYTADWSRNGRRILLAQDPKVNNPRPNVWISILDLRTKKIKKIRKLNFGGSARWSPNNRRIVFANRGAIYVMNADGSHVRRLV
jgi:Tol biopolymer transport system component